MCYGCEVMNMNTLVWRKKRAFSDPVENRALEAFRKGETYVTTRYTYYLETLPYGQYVWRVRRICHKGKTLPPPELVARYAPGSIL